MIAPPTVGRLMELLSYEPETGLFRWRVSRGKAQPGVLAGSVYGDRHHAYVTITVDRRHCRAHQLAWLYMTGGWPEMEVDHRNRVKTDNRWENLRLATPTQNQANAGARITNLSGLKGAHWHKKTKKWRARIRENGCERALGYFHSPEAAHAAYCAAAKDVHGEFAAF